MCTIAIIFTNTIDKFCGQGFGEVLKKALQEIKNTYFLMLNKQINILAEQLQVVELKSNQGSLPFNKFCSYSCIKAWFSPSILNC
jgi:hypothetical protein